MNELSKVPAAGALPPPATALVSDINQLRNTLGQAQSSGHGIVAWMVELDLLGLVGQLIALVGIKKAVALMDG